MLFLSAACVSFFLLLVSLSIKSCSSIVTQPAQLLTGYGPRAVITMAVSTADKKWTIEKLNRANWSTWKFQMKHLLLAKELWGMVDGTETLAEDVTAAARTEFQKRSQKAFSTLVLAIGTSQLYLVTFCETPKDAWDALRSHFE